MKKSFTINEKGNSIRCLMYYADVKAVRRAVICAHGFGGNKDNKSAERFSDYVLKKHKDIVVITYDAPAHGEDVKRKLMLDAVGDAYRLLMALGYPVRPAGDEKSLEPGPANAMVRLIIYWMSRTRLGALCTTEHCRHAPGEMEDLDAAFGVIRAGKPEFPMPAFERLKAMMPSWDKIRETYAR